MRCPASALATTLALAAAAPRARAQCELQTFVGSASPAFSDFGRSIFADGSRAAIGAPLEGLSGAVYVFEEQGGAWVETARLVPSDAGSYVAPGQFGVSIALSGDRLLVGADHAGPGAAGAAYVFELQGGAWVETDKLLPAATVDMLWFGSAVALEGGRAAVGAAGASNQSGALYVFEEQAGAWVQTAQVLASDAGPSDDHLGRSLALSGSWLVAGAPDDSDKGMRAGAVYVFELQGGAWVQAQQIHATDASSPEQFGFSVALRGTTLAVGAIRGWVKTFSSSVVQCGRVFVFERSGGAWNQTEFLSAPDAWDDENYGTCVALSSDRLAVGVPFDDAAGERAGSVYVYGRAGTRWMLSDKLLARDGLPLDQLGTSVAFAGKTLLVGAAARNESAQDSGAVHAFTADGPHCPGTPCAQDKLIASDAHASSYFFEFGKDVALAGDTALVIDKTGWPYVFQAAGTHWRELLRLPVAQISQVALESEGGAYRALLAKTAAASESVLVWSGSGTSWAQVAALSASDGVPGDSFGAALAQQGDLIVVGALSDDHGSLDAAGSAYVFRRIGGIWVQEAKLVAADATTFATFGSSVALAGEVVLVGAAGDGGKGAAYAFRRVGGVWVQEAKLLPSDAGGLFGRAAAFDGTYAALGSTWNDELTGPDTQAGAVYLFRRDAGVWTQTQKLLPPVGLEGTFHIPATTYFGAEVALSGDRLAVGALGGPVASIERGRVSLYRRDAIGQWQPEGSILGYDGLWGGRFGCSIALQGERMLVGDSGDNEMAFGAGAVYSYSFDGSDCPSLVAHSRAIDYLLGGTQDLALRPPAATAGDLYWVLGSVSGIAPPTPILGVLVPLAHDVYFDLTLFQPGAVPLKASVGFVDAGGAAHAQFDLPGLIYGLLQGTRAYHAYGTIDLATLAVTHVSDPVQMIVK